MTGWRKNRLDVDDLFRCSRHDESQRIVQELEKHWNNERQKKVAQILEGIGYDIRGVLYTAPVHIYIVVQPVLLGIVIDYFSKVKTSTFDHACVAAGGVCYSSALFISLYHPANLLTTQMGMRIRASTCTLMFKKSLRLSRASLGKATVGHIVNLMSNDVSRFDAFSMDACYLLVAPIQTAIAVYIIYTEIGYYCFVGVALLLLFMLFQAFMSKLISKVRLMTAQLTDSRLRLMNEIISGMRVIKIFSPRASAGASSIPVLWLRYNF
ncbi:unnamed protein product [Oppiella nova]|uniref:ABC transmembrane type-1 domain-containing protein n=1 Tax=Oppiella nova TaxID=334625 RepID=A0A7R9MEG2_9ACAR|nr:unnamed protein product [Oppiella nova]CAG2174896.1 unnamed protein product [Oppiella nova]